MRRSPFFPATTKVAPRTSAQAGSSAAGSASAQLPPKVPRLRIAGCPICGIAEATSGRCLATSAARSRSTWRVSAPMRTKLFVTLIPPSDSLRLISPRAFRAASLKKKGKRSRVGDVAARLAAIKISEGFNLGYCRALPGKGPMLHNHDTNETLIAMTGTWRASWENERGRLEHVDLKPLDLISFPPGASRRFMNVTKGPKNKPSILMFVIGGDAPSAEFTSESMRRIEAAGAMPRQRETAQ